MSGRTLCKWGCFFSHIHIRLIEFLVHCASEMHHDLLSLSTPKDIATFTPKQLAKFVTVDISYMSFSNPSELSLLALICFACLMFFSDSTCLIFVASTEHEIAFSLAWLYIHVSISVTCDACAVDHMVKFTRPSPSVFAYCKRSKPGAGVCFHGNKAKSVTLSEFVLNNFVAKLGCP